VASMLQASSRGTVTLLYSSHDCEHNNAVALKEFLTQNLHAEKLHDLRQKSLRVLRPVKSTAVLS